MPLLCFSLPSGHVIAVLKVLLTTEDALCAGQTPPWHSLEVAPAHLTSFKALHSFLSSYHQRDGCDLRLCKYYEVKRGEVTGERSELLRDGAAGELPPAGLRNNGPLGILAVRGERRRCPHNPNQMMLPNVSFRPLWGLCGVAVGQTSCMQHTWRRANARCACASLCVW